MRILHFYKHLHSLHENLYNLLDVNLLTSSNYEVLAFFKKNAPFNLDINKLNEDLKVKVQQRRFAKAKVKIINFYLIILILIVEKTDSNNEERNNRD